MCGINGILQDNHIDSSVLTNKIKLMNDQIIHRGPDDHGCFTESTKEFSIAMGMRRLSIIDLNSGQQPIYSDDNNIVIVFNGEIYNYKKLRADLSSKNITFNTKSDTEVILKLYQYEGVEGFRKLDGMFGFSIYDRIKKKVFIGRDFFGEKPLYFTQYKNQFLWASELKSILKAIPTVPTINKLGLNLFFKLTYIPAPFSIYEGIHKLQPNHLLIYDLKKSSWSTDSIKSTQVNEKEDISFNSAKLKVRELVAESVKSRSVSDVPIGTFLSGGVDSSIVSLCLSRISNQKINTFSIGFEKKGFDERDKSRTVANLIDSNHHEFVLNEDDLKTNVSEILDNFDEPFSDSSSLPSYLVAHQTSKHVKVALTGDGGDEVFGGYNKYYIGKINERYTQLIPNQLHKLSKRILQPLLYSKSDKRGIRFKINKLLNSIDYSNQYYWDIISLGFANNSLQDYLLPNFIELDPFAYYKSLTGVSAPNSLTDYREVDRNISLEGDMLVKVDRTSMLTSLECRAPFLNKKLWDYTNSLPEDFLMKGWNKKYILKEAFKEDFPEDFLDKSKSGFGVPIGDWLRSSLKKELKKYIEPSFLETQQIFNTSSIQKLVNDHLNGKDNTFMVWTYFCFQKWYCKNYLGSSS
ncbi:asparagine synthase (glutamine-hydrolyzing) [Muricauda brasiliensis]|uniref:asparagine synthase (glutamine-hydrolyzing) n=1 Tax=Muricauda brasiliensis TaxID=2162892 RepID=UPI000D35FF89|nr:asparagine synthase (glutamine-hydrolyzing) [Muricauda brasiliensis]